jgi:hypothetical protein
MNARRHIVSVLAAAACMVAFSAVAVGASKDLSQMSSEVSSRIDAMKDTLGVAVQRLQEARSNKDIIQINCVNDRLSIIKGLLSISERADIAMKEASASGDTELVKHEHTKVSIAAMRVENLRVEVEGCVGEGVQHTGGTVVERVVDKDIRTDDPSDEGLTPDVSTVVEQRPAVVTGSK